MATLDRLLDLSAIPPIYVSTTHLELDQIHDLEIRLAAHNAVLTYDPHEARIILSKVERKRRAQFDLQSKGVWTQEIDARLSELQSDNPPVFKRSRTEKTSAQTDKDIRVTDPLDNASKVELYHKAASMDPNVALDTAIVLGPDEIIVVKFDWFEQSLDQHRILDINNFVIFRGCVILPPPDSPSTGPDVPHASASRNENSKIVERAKADVNHNSAVSGQRTFAGRQHDLVNAVSTNASFGHDSGPKRYAHLLQQTTSEYDHNTSSDLPDSPDWIKNGLKYSCQRVSFAENKNHEFISLLKEIKLARLLTNDEIGVRAYSTCIAAIASYPYRLSSPREILAMPGCDVKLANLFVEYANTGKLQAAIDARENEELKVLRLFYEIWGVGAVTAREFFFDRGWRELDDIVEFGWSSLSRVQQIGVKFYDEFLSPIPRAEVEQIASIIHRHAVKVRDQGIQSLVVGGYRRGKQECGDVDLIVSHPDEAQTLNIVNDIVASLETEGWITHTLLLSLTTSHRDQKTLPYRAGPGGHGFDSLDKALVVWQDPEWPSKSSDLARNPKAKNPNIHRRVDIIIAPWRTVGCAVAGWTSGTTFQRDLRRYVKHTRGWKFDSSGVRDRVTGEVIDVEGYNVNAGGPGRAKTMVEAEKRVFQSLDLEWREPWERCTG